MMKNKFEEAKSALEWLRYPNKDITDELQVKFTNEIFMIK